MNIQQIYELNASVLDGLYNLRKESFNLIKEILGEDGVAVFDNGAETLTITYNGGNHPEYDAYPYAEVKSIYSKGGDIFLNLDRCEDYLLVDVCEPQSMFDIFYHLHNYAFMKGCQIHVTGEPSVTYIVDDVDRNGNITFHHESDPSLKRVAKACDVYIRQTRFEYEEMWKQREVIAEEFSKLAQRKIPAFQMPNGDLLYLQYNKERDTLDVGTVTNTGLSVRHVFPYDYNFSLDSNIETVYEKLSEMEEYQNEEE